VIGLGRKVLVGQILAMADDEELFEAAMDTLGTKRGARAWTRPLKQRPEGVTVTEDVDFDALMRGSKGPAIDLSKVPPTKTITPLGGNVEAAPIVEQKVSVDRSRYAATAQEAGEFAAAMQGLGSPPADRLESVGVTRGTSPADDLARRLKRGDVESDAVLDLHGSTQRVAQAKLADFIKEARAEGWEVVTIVVGKGLRSERGESVLRPLVERWLVEDHRAEVREVHQAPPYMGGTGAWVAAIRK